MKLKLNKLMRFILIILMLISFNVKGQKIRTSKNMEQEIEIGTLEGEVSDFIDKVNNKYYKISKNFVFVIRVLEESKDCRNYTIGIIFNKPDYEKVKPEYIALDSNNLIIVSFSPKIRDKTIPDYELVKIDCMKENQIMEKLLRDGVYITGFFYGLEYEKCGEELGKTFYENSDMIPQERSIYQSFPTGVTIELIKEGDEVE